MPFFHNVKTLTMLKKKKIQSFTIFDTLDNFDNFFTMFTFAKTILETCDIWDTDYNSDNWEPQFRQSLWPDLRLLTVRSQRLSNVNCQFFITSLPLFSLVLTGFHIWTICIDRFSMVFYRCTIAIYWMVFRFTIGINGSMNVHKKNMNSNQKNPLYVPIGRIVTLIAATGCEGPSTMVRNPTYAVLLWNQFCRELHARWRGG